MPTAIVTGATGFVGSHLVDHLLEKEWRVTVTVRRTSSLKWLEGKPVERLETDFSAPLPGCDVLFHVAGAIRADSWQEFLAGNRDLSVRVFEAARTGRFVHVSSLAAAGPGRRIDESAPCAPISLYGKSKAEGEREVWRRRDRTPVTVARPPVVYGPRDMALLDLFKTMAAGLRPEVGGPKEISLVHVRDLVEGLVLAAERPEGAGEVFFLSNGKPWLMSELMDLIQASLGGRPVRLPVPDRVVRFLGAVVEDASKVAGFRSMFGRDKALEMTQEAWSCRPEKARRLLGWEARIPVERGMAETLAWYRGERLL